MPPDSLIEDSDMATIAAPLDFLGVNYYQPVHLRPGDPDNLRRDEEAPPAIREWAVKLLVHPRIAGHGPTLYQSGLPSTRRLELVSAKPLRSGAVAMHYRRAR